MIYQTDTLLATWIQHYGCTADALASYREFKMAKPWRVHEFASSLHLAVDKGIISGDMNGDDNMDGLQEAMIQDFQKLADHFGLPLKYLGKFDQTAFDGFNDDKHWVLCAWYNPHTKFIHWVIGNKKPVFWDSIKGGSMTVNDGAPHPLQKDGSGGLRVFEVVG